MHLPSQLPAETDAGMQFAHRTLLQGDKLSTRLTECLLQPFPATLSCKLPAVATFARHSGGHLNPAISLAAALSGHMAWGSAAMYMLAQVCVLLLLVGRLCDVAAGCAGTGV
jgi:hypothetical protein